MTTDLQQENKNNKKAVAIITGAFIALHAISLLISKNRFGQVNDNHILWAIPVLAVGFLIWVDVKLWGGADVTEEKKLPYIVAIVLAFASCWAVAYCPTC